MRIGQVAALLGVSTRTIRHYHHMGVLPEPAREPNGYRHYSLQDAVLLARARRLTALGMSLDEVADSLSGHCADLEEVLSELDGDLARQEKEIREARTRIADLLNRVRTSDAPLTPPALTRFVEQVGTTGAEGPSARLDAQLLSLLPEEEADRWFLSLFPDPADHGTHDGLRRLYGQMDSLTGPDDPQVSELAAQVVALVPPAARADIARMLTNDEHDRIVDAISSQLTSGQAAVFQHVLDLLGRS